LRAPRRSPTPGCATTAATTTPRPPGTPARARRAHSTTRPRARRQPRRTSRRSGSSRPCSSPGSGPRASPWSRPRGEPGGRRQRSRDAAAVHVSPRRGAAGQHSRRPAHAHAQRPGVRPDLRGRSERRAGLQDHVFRCAGVEPCTQSALGALLRSPWSRAVTPEVDDAHCLAEWPCAAVGVRRPRATPSASAPHRNAQPREGGPTESVGSSCGEGRRLIVPEASA
jgi:hypothetical protein